MSLMKIPGSLTRPGIYTADQGIFSFFSLSIGLRSIGYQSFSFIFRPFHLLKIKHKKMYSDLFELNRERVSESGWHDVRELFQGASLPNAQ